MRNEAFLLKDIEKFIWKAKKSTYAKDGDFYEKDGMKYHSFRDGFYRFEDRKIGDQYYSGQEVIFLEEKPVWTMSYSGGILTDAYESAEIYRFLHQSLMAEERRNTLRGPSFYQQAQMFYFNEFSGDVERFNGREYIRIGNKIIYELHYSGGKM